MASRRTAGRRVAAVRKSAVRSGGARRKAEPLKRQERRLLLQLVLCGGAFVLLVAVKLLLPARMEQLQTQLNGALERNMDVQAVFSAVGRAFSGESGPWTAAGEVYQAVFGGEMDSVAVSAPIFPERSEHAMDALRQYRSAESASTDDGAQAETPTTSYVLYSEENLPEGVSVEQALLGFEYCAPAAGSISSGFGYREHPTEGENRFHYGIDLAADAGTDIVCFADGVVTAVGESSSYGNYCTVEHENGCSTLYAHCGRITAASGKQIQRGEKLGEVGSTGMATGPHLHFELQRDGVYLNPIYYVSGS